MVAANLAVVVTASILAVSCHWIWWQWHRMGLHLIGEVTAPDLVLIAAGSVLLAVGLVSRCPFRVAFGISSMARGVVFGFS